MTSYNYTNGYSLLSYLEYPIILVQEYILIFLVLKYLNKINTWAFLFTIIYFVISSCLLFEVAPKIVLSFLAVSMNIILCVLRSIFTIFDYTFIYQQYIPIFSPCVPQFPLLVKLFNCWL